ncbi:putative F-box domain-containing protein [Medicago truncatula]|nr:putative F-box domain-containing protein [Medicago truncatula]
MENGNILISFRLERKEPSHMDSSREGRQTLKLLSSGHSLHSQPLPTLPFDLIPDILSRLQVKFLLQLRCVCKSWKSLISDPKFAKKHLRLSTMRSLHFVGYKQHSLGKYVLKSYPLHSILKNINTNFTQFEYFANNFDGDYLADSFRYFIDSCDGILCIGGSYKGLVILWNPSLRKFKELPLFEKPKVTHLRMSFGFGYDSFKENYKVIVVLHYLIRDSTGSDNWVHKSEVKVHTLGSNIWKNIHEFPFGVFPVARSGKFVSGTINWLASRQFHPCTRSIVSFDLAKESYQKISPPSYGGVDVCNMLTLGVLRDCLCLICGDDVWVIMKEYGKKESWNKLFTIPYMLYRGRYSIYTKVIYVFEDDQVLLKDLSDSALILYNSKNGTHKSINFIDIPEVCIESLIWPCS